MKKETIIQKFDEFLKKYGAYELYDRKLKTPKNELLKHLAPENFITKAFDWHILDWTFLSKLNDLWLKELKKISEQPEEEQIVSQNKAILKHLEAGNTITAIEALKMFGCFRLSARIYNLKEQGHDIASELVFENGKKFSNYYLIPHNK